MDDRPNVPRDGESTPIPARPGPALGGDGPGPAEGSMPHMRGADREVVRPRASEAVWRSMSALRDAQARRRRIAGQRVATAEAIDDEAEGDADRSVELRRLLSHLRTTLTAFVCAQRDEGRPVERVLAHVQSLVREAAALDGVEPVERLTHHVVRWTIETYYDRPELRGSPQFY